MDYCKKCVPCSAATLYKYGSGGDGQAVRTMVSSASKFVRVWETIPNAGGGGGGGIIVNAWGLVALLIWRERLVILQCKTDRMQFKLGW